uniref:Uncharacterized protein n=1 Tax=Oryza barthii TaxID=65489 RepID=A0A0D3F7W8_9ORYZ
MVVSSTKAPSTPSAALSPPQVLHQLCGCALASDHFRAGEAAASQLPREKVAEPVGLFAFLLSSTMEALPIFMQEQEILAKEISLGIYSMTSSTVVPSVPTGADRGVHSGGVLDGGASKQNVRVNSEGIAVKRYVG